MRVTEIARVAELVDALDLGSSGVIPVGVRVPPLALGSSHDGRDTRDPGAIFLRRRLVIAAMRSIFEPYELPCILLGSTRRERAASRD